MASPESHHSPSDIAEHLRGIDFPAGRDQLVDHAKELDASDAVLNVIEQMPDREYGSMADVMKGVGKVE